MQTDWLNYINKELENAPSYSESDEYLCPAEHLGLIHVEGDDALVFLQNQFSNDIAKIDDNTCQLNSYSNHKGRMFSIFYVLKHNDGFLLILPKSQIEFMLQRLQMFVIMAKVTLTDISEQWAKIAYQSQSIANNDLVESNQINQNNGSLYLRLNPNNPNRVLVLTPFSSSQSIWSKYKEKLCICTSNTWQLSEINEGIPSLNPETSEAFVLQMTNLQLLNGVNFKKGCFPGQEIVARTKYLGKAKRRMYLASVETSTKPLAKDELCELSSDKADNSGKIVNSAQADNNHYHFLFVGNIEKAEANSLKLLNQPNAKLIIKKLPYSFEE